MSRWIETYSGGTFDYDVPTVDQLKIEDIAAALSKMCRFNGHCSMFYSVAEHSFLVSLLLDGTGLELDGLLHDASEAFIADIPSPAKELLPDYENLERKIMAVVSEKFGISYPNALVKDADINMLSTEAFYLLKSRGNNWDLWDYYAPRPPVQADCHPLCWSPGIAEKMFLARFKQLTEKKNDEVKESR
jgi:hypothetical protein